MRETREFQERIGRIEALIQKLESAADPALRESARELIGALMDMQGAALERILEVATSAGEAGLRIVESLAADPLVGSLLVLHDLHPDPFEARVRRAIEKVRPTLRAQGCHMGSLVIEAGAVRVRLIGGAADLASLVRRALLETAPDAVEVIVDGGGETTQAAGFVPVSSLLPAGAART